jgi:hypothetical protein
MQFQSLEDAVFRGSSNLADAVRYVMQSGNPNELFDDHHGTLVSVLHYFVMGKVKLGVEGMLSIGADPNVRTSNGETPLLMAVINDDSAIARLLVEKGADVNAREPREGNTPLHAALFAGKHEMAQLLMSSGADAGIPNNKGITARAISAFQRAGRPDPAKLLENLAGMSEEELYAVLELLPLMIKIRVDSGGMTPQRAMLLEPIIRELKETINLDHITRAVRLAELRDRLLAIMAG